MPDITPAAKVKFNVADGQLIGTVTRVWGRFDDKNVTILCDGRTYVRRSSMVTEVKIVADASGRSWVEPAEHAAELVQCPRCPSIDTPAYADRHAATHRRDDRNHADRVAADTAATRAYGPAGRADVIGQVPDASRARELWVQMTNWLGSVSEDVPTDTACSDLIEWCRSARDLLADLASWTDAR